MPEDALERQPFYCPYPGCKRKFASLWRLKVHYRAPPHERGSGKERGHGVELPICPACGEELEPGKHHNKCKAGRTTNPPSKRVRKTTQRPRIEKPTSSRANHGLAQRPGVRDGLANAGDCTSAASNPAFERDEQPDLDLGGAVEQSIDSDCGGGMGVPARLQPEGGAQPSSWAAASAAPAACHGTPSKAAGASGMRFDPAAGMPRATLTCSPSTLTEQGAAKVLYSFHQSREAAAAAGGPVGASSSPASVAASHLPHASFAPMLFATSHSGADGEGLQQLQPLQVMQVSSAANVALGKPFAGLPIPDGRGDPEAAAARTRLQQPAIVVTGQTADGVPVEALGCTIPPMLSMANMGNMGGIGAPAGMVMVAVPQNLMQMVHSSQPYSFVPVAAAPAAVAHAEASASGANDCPDVAMQPAMLVPSGGVGMIDMPEQAAMEVVCGDGPLTCLQLGHGEAVAAPSAGLPGNTAALPAGIPMVCPLAMPDACLDAACQGVSEEEFQKAVQMAAASEATATS